jgi:hypothetical protein
LARRVKKKDIGSQDKRGLGFQLRSYDESIVLTSPHVLRRIQSEAINGKYQIA